MANYLEFSLATPKDVLYDGPKLGVPQVEELS
jgi:hypothetical protein